MVHAFFYLFLKNLEVRGEHNIEEMAEVEEKKDEDKEVNKMVENCHMNGKS